MEGSQVMSPDWSKVSMERGGIGYVVQPRALPYILTGPSGCPTLSERELLRIPKG